MCAIVREEIQKDLKTCALAHDAALILLSLFLAKTDKLGCQFEVLPRILIGVATSDHKKNCDACKATRKTATHAWTSLRKC